MTFLRVLTENAKKMPWACPFISPSPDAPSGIYSSGTPFPTVVLCADKNKDEFSLAGFLLDRLSIECDLKVEGVSCKEGRNDTRNRVGVKVQETGKVMHV